MALLVPDVGEVLLLKAVVDPATTGNQENWTLKLMSANTTIAESDTAGTYTEATFTGYSSKTLTRGSWGTPATASGTTSSSYAQQSWSATSAQTVYGYWVVGATSTTLLFAENFGSIALTNPSTLNLTPKLQLD